MVRPIRPTDKARLAGGIALLSLESSYNVAAHRLFAHLSEHLDTSLHGGLHELTAQLAA